MRFQQKIVTDLYRTFSKDPVYAEALLLFLYLILKEEANFILFNATPN